MGESSGRPPVRSIPPEGDTCERNKHSVITDTALHLKTHAHKDKAQARRGHYWQGAVGLNRGTQRQSQGCVVGRYRGRGAGGVGGVGALLAALSHRYERHSGSNAFTPASRQQDQLAGTLS